MRQKLNLNFYLFCLIWGLYIIPCNAKQAGTRLIKSVNEDSVLLDIKITDSLLAKTPKKKAHIFIMISKYPFTYITQYEMDKRTYEKELAYGESINLAINPPAELFYLYISFSSRPDYGGWSSFDNMYMLEKGDKIRCEVSNNYFKFSGKGSLKLRCQSECYKHQYIMSDYDMNLLSQHKELEFINRMDLKRDSVLNIQMDIIKKHEHQLGLNLSKIILANCYGLRDYMWLRFLSIEFKTNNPAYDLFKAYKNRANRSKNEFTNNLDSVNIDKSYIFIDYLFYKILVEEIVRCDNDDVKINSKQFFDGIFRKINYNAHSSVKEKLLAYFIMYIKNSKYLKDYLDETITIVHSKKYKQIILDIKKRTPVGLPFYNFSLEDVDGNMVTLDKYQTKVVLMDFWFTGCAPCRLLKKAMQPIIDKYRDNNNFVLLSISTDKSKLIWKESVNNGYYSDANSINLYTNGLGENHPMLKHHGIQGAPALFLLKEGKIFASPLPMPTLDKATELPTIEGDTGNLIKLIDEALSDL